MATQSDSAPSGLAPHFRPLGIHRTKIGYPIYYLEVHGQPRAFRAGELHGLPFLLMLVPDVDHWRALFPRGRGGRRVDTAKACAYFMTACEQAGSYRPPRSDDD